MCEVRADWDISWETWRSSRQTRLIQSTAIVSGRLRMKVPLFAVCVLMLSVGSLWADDAPTAQQLAKWLKRFPRADTNGDGKLTAQEAAAFWQATRRAGVVKTFQVNPGWNAERFPDHAVCYKKPDEIANLFRESWEQSVELASYPKPVDASLRIVGTGHSFMVPGYRTFPLIARAAGLQQPPLVTHTGGGITGSARYKWEQENGIFQFHGKPRPKLLATIANAEWDAMLWGPYYDDRPEFYSCWIDFCLQHNPHMKFFLSDAWPQLDQLDQRPKSEDKLTAELFVRLGQEKHAACKQLIETLNEQYPKKVFVMPTCEAMVLAVDYFLRGKLPGVKGVHTLIGHQQRSLWRDKIGHLGPGFDRLEGYVFYATIYRKSPTLIKGDISFGGSQDYPGRDLDRIFRKIAWQAVVNNPLSGIADEDGNGVAD